MNEALAVIADLTPAGAVLVLASLAQVAIVQVAKQQSWSKQRTQLVSVAVAGVLGLIAAVVLGLVEGVPDSIVQIVSSVLLSVAAVAVIGRALYGVLGYVIPDNTTPDEQDTVNVTVNSTADPEIVAQAIAEHGRRHAALSDADVRAAHAPVDDA